MAKTRVPIPPELSAQVLFASDRTCCVCRQPERTIEIHHIDSDPSNNAFSNLAVVCKDCQSDAHTTHAFARNLTPETVQLYNVSWRSIVASRLSPNSSIEQLGHQIAGLYEIESRLRQFEGNLRWRAESNGHEWKNIGRFGERYSEELNATFSASTWQAYAPVWEKDWPNLTDRLERILLLYADVVPIELKAEVLAISHMMRSEQGQYQRVNRQPRPDYLKQEDIDSMFSFRFAALMGMIKSARAAVEKFRISAEQRFENCVPKK